MITDYENCFRTIRHYEEANRNMCDYDETTESTYIEYLEFNN